MKREHYQIALKARKVFREILVKKKKYIGHYSLQNSMASVAAVYLDDKVYNNHLMISTNQACHAGLQSLHTGSVAVISGLQPKYKGNLIDKEEGVAFLDWLLNRSPYSEVFVTKSAKDAIKNSCIIADSNYPSNLLAAGLVASRRLWEYSEIVIVWYDLVKAGMNEDLAYWVAHKAQCRSDRTGNIGFTGCQSGHCSMNPDLFDREALKAWLNHKVVNPNQTYSQSTRYNYYDRMYSNLGKLKGEGYWVEPPEDSIGYWLDKNFDPKKKDGVNNNPFVKALPKAEGACRYADGIKAMAEFEKKIMEEVNRA